MGRETDLQRHYREGLAKEKIKREKEYQELLEYFAGEAISTIRAIVRNSDDPETIKMLIEAIELDWTDLQQAKKNRIS